MSYIVVLNTHIDDYQNTKIVGVCNNKNEIIDSVLQKDIKDFVVKYCMDLANQNEIDKFLADNDCEKLAYIDDGDFYSFKLINSTSNTPVNIYDNKNVLFTGTFKEMFNYLNN